MRKRKEQWVEHVNSVGGETSRQLMEAEIPVPDAVVENFLNLGEIMILAGSPKVGKSVIKDQLAIAVACGGKFLGEFQAQCGMVLLYDVDDGNRYRAQQRLEDLGLDAENENITLFHSLKSIPDGGIAQIECDLTAAAASGHKVNLVLIDCLLSILGTGLSRNVVQDQRRQIQELRALAVKYQFAGVIIHHTCKKAPKGAQGFSVFDAMLGTTGIGTVVDVGVVLESTGRAGEVLARFSGRNPDTPTELALKLDRVGRTGWKVMSVGDQAREGRELGRVARAILEVLENAGTSMTPFEIAAEHKGEPKLNPSSVRVNCRRMLKRGYLTEHEGGRYGIPETPVTPVTASASDCGEASSESYSYSYTRPEEQPRPATVTATARLEIVPSRAAGTAVWSTPSLATDPSAAPRPLTRQKQPPAEPVSKANPVATAPQTAQQQAPAVKTPKVFTAEEKDNRILGALDELGGTASARGVADFLKVTNLSKVGKITAHMEDMCDRRRLVREDTRTGTVYSKATVGQTALERAVDVEAPAEPAAAPEAPTAPDAAAEPDQDLAKLDAKIIDCMAQGKSGYIPIAQAIGTTRDTVEHRMKAMLADGRLVNRRLGNRRDGDDCMMPGLPAPVMPEGLTMEDQILWAVTGGHRRCGLISEAIGADVFEVHRMLKTMRDGYILDSLVVGGSVDHYLPGSKPTAVAQAPAKTSPPVKTPDPSGILPGESCQAYQRRKAFEAAEAAKPSRFSQHSQAN